MENHSTSLADDFLQSLQGMKEVETDPFFYTRLKGRMQQHVKPVFFLKPAWVIATLAFFVSLNIWMISQGSDINNNLAEKKSAEQVFAETYNLNSATNY